MAPPKGTDHLMGLTPNQVKFLLLGVLYMEAPLKVRWSTQLSIVTLLGNENDLKIYQIDVEKLAAKTGYQVTSARATFNGALRKLKEFNGVGAVDTAAKAADDNGDDPAAAPGAGKKVPKPPAKATRSSKRKRQNEEADADEDETSSVEALEPVPDSE
ncbi:hypothetical protein N7486_000940 [Penicillium sp. IBT 16267x]|nr:hypothetical protein N7486_000940 [Penicillium sp. IBT 16267x]